MARTAGVRRLPALGSFEDWTPPWKEGEFDAEKAKKLIFDLHKDKETLFTELDKKDTEIADLEDEADTLEEQTRKAAGASQPKEGENAEIAALRAEIDALKNGNKPQTRRERREAAEAEAAKAPSDDSLLATKYEIALDKGLSKSAARRLVGSTREEIEADADAYLEENGGASKGAGEQTAGKAGQAPPSQRPKVKGRTGTAGDEVDPDDGLDPGALYDKVVGANT